jgi:hypothetical protein
LEDSQGRTGVVVHPNPGAVDFRDWTQWAIPLSSFAETGVDLTSIRHMVFSASATGPTRSLTARE